MNVHEQQMRLDIDTLTPMYAFKGGLADHLAQQIPQPSTGPLQRFGVDARVHE